VEFGAVRNESTFLILNDQQLKTMAESLPRMCDTMCDNEQYGCKDGDFKLNKKGSFKVARLYLDKQYISLRLVGLQYLFKMFHVFQNQLNMYTLSLPDVLSYVIVALISTTSF